MFLVELVIGLRRAGQGACPPLPAPHATGPTGTSARRYEPPPPGLVHRRNTTVHCFVLSHWGQALPIGGGGGGTLVPRLSRAAAACGHVPQGQAVPDHRLCPLVVCGTSLFERLLCSFALQSFESKSNSNDVGPLGGLAHHAVPCAACVGVVVSGPVASGVQWTEDSIKLFVVQLDSKPHHRRPMWHSAARGVLPHEVDWRQRHSVRWTAHGKRDASSRGWFVTPAKDQVSASGPTLYSPRCLGPDSPSGQSPGASRRVPFFGGGGASPNVILASRLPPRIQHSERPRELCGSGIGKGGSPTEDPVEHMVDLQEVKAQLARNHLPPPPPPVRTALCESPPPWALCAVE